MGRFRLSIARSLGIVMFAAVILAAFRSGSNDGFKLVYSLTFAVLVYAAIAARYRGPFWHGFAVAGWAYFLLGFGPWINGVTGISQNQRVVNRDLVTSVLIEAASSLPRPPIRFNPKAVSGSPSRIVMDNAMANRDGVVHSSLTWIIACLGGYVSRRTATHAPHGSALTAAPDSTRESTEGS